MSNDKKFLVRVYKVREPIDTNELLIDGFVDWDGFQEINFIVNPPVFVTDEEIERLEDMLTHMSHSRFSELKTRVDNRELSRGQYAQALANAIADQLGNDWKLYKEEQE